MKRLFLGSAVACFGAACSSAPQTLPDGTGLGSVTHGDQTDALTVQLAFSTSGGWIQTVSSACLARP